MLCLSATPVEDDYRQLWNQLDVFGKSAVAAGLEGDANDEEKKRITSTFLVRRVTSMPVNGQTLTKNLYRREWRGGGVDRHDEPLIVPGDAGRLVVALVQKKVSEILRSAAFSNSFQIGMLASFESFLETSRSTDTTDVEVPSVFDDADQTERPEERQGADVSIVNTLTRDYRRKFERELPHPKMEALVRQLAAQAFTDGRKALVFVRRVASVKELQRKLEEQYDDLLTARLHRELNQSLLPELDSQFSQYRTLRQTERRFVLPRAQRHRSDDDEETPLSAPEPDTSGVDSFFAWFFRGQGPEGILSGASVQRRLNDAGGTLSTFFEDNHVASVLGVRPEEAWTALEARLGPSVPDLTTELRRRASQSPYLGASKRIPRRNLFFAFQHAALTLLTSDRDIGNSARTVLNESYAQPMSEKDQTQRLPQPEDWLTTRTFFTELRQRPDLRSALWPEPTATDTTDAYREQELRRELLAAMCRLGHPLIDLFIIVANRTGSLSAGVRERDDEADIDVIKRSLTG